MQLKFRNSLFWPLISLLLSACGGGSAGPEFAVSIPDVMYGKKAFFTVTGTGLDRVSKITIKKCAALTLENSGENSKTVSCIPSATGVLSVDLKTADEAVLYTQMFTVSEPQVTISTNLGSLVVELNPTAAPVTVNNFLNYVGAQFYDSTIIHRVVPNFVVQGGWLTPAPAIQEGSSPPIALESNNGLSNLRGTIGMARTVEPNSATSQFYFNLVDNLGLNYVSAAKPGYAVFGKIVQGLEVMDAMGKVTTGSKYGLNDFPLTDVVVWSMQQTR